MPAIDGISHVVVLMLENRSFDCMFGKLYPKGAAFEGLSGHESNPWHKDDGSVETVTVWNDSGMGPATACIPDPDPGELFLSDMNMQLFGLNGASGTGVPTMDGFVDNYARQKLTNPAPDARSVMHYFTPEQVPVISQLARAFGVSDQWHASAPCQTWPNRFFAHTATAGGYVDNAPAHFPYLMPSIFKRLSEAGKSWKVYYHDLPQAATLADLWLDASHFKRFDEEFAADAAAGNLPNYSFIEPRYFTDDFGKRLPSDEHPPHNVVYGEQLIAAVYNAVRAAPTWKSSLLIVTYDEHGGCYDHVPPPLAVAPAPVQGADAFPFNRYGVRVPAVIVSPYMPPGSIVRVAEQGLPHQGPPYPFDHTSILATLRKLFALGAPLTARDAVAPDLLGPLSLLAPENDGPASIAATEATPSAADIANSLARPANHMQQSLCAMAAHLPPNTAQAGVHLAAMAAPITDQHPASAAVSPAEVKQYALDSLKSFLG